MGMNYIFWNLMAQGEGEPHNTPGFLIKGWSAVQRDYNFMLAHGIPEKRWHGSIKIN